MIREVALTLFTVGLLSGCITDQRPTWNVVTDIDNPALQVAIDRWNTNLGWNAFVTDGSGENEMDIAYTDGGVFDLGIDGLIGEDWNDAFDMDCQIAVLFPGNMPEAYLHDYANIFEHEMGHCLGLKHEGYRQSLMFQGIGSDFTVNMYQQLENLYGPLPNKEHPL